MNTNISDIQILEALSRSDSREIDLAIDSLYSTAFPSIKAYILKNSGTQEEANDVFQDALVIFYMKVRKGGFENKSGLNTYLYAVSKNLWLKQLRTKDSHGKIEMDINSTEYPQELILQQNQTTIRQVLELMDNECRELLIDFYFDGMSVRELKVQYRLGSEAAAKNKKYRCLKKLINLVRERKWVRSDFAND